MRIAALVLAVMFALWIGIRAATPPRAEPASAAPTAFSATRAMVDVRAIAMRPHPTGSVDIVRVRSALIARLLALGIQPEERRYMLDREGLATLRRWNPKADPASEIVDLVGILPGRDHAKPAVALMAHMDTVWGSPGGGDDSVGVAAILEVLRAIKARGTPERDILVLLTDGEEIGLSGAKAFWPSDGLATHAGVVVNLEARGAGGRATMFETGASNGGMMALFGAAVGHPVANSMSVMAYRLMPNSTDFTPVRVKGLPGFNFAIMGRPAYYHSPRATADRVDPRSLQDMGDQVLDLVAGLAFAGAWPSTARDAVFFDVAGQGFVQYGPLGGWLVLLAGGAGLAAAWAGARRVGPLGFREIGGGMLALLWLAAHGALLLAVLNLLSGSAHPNYYDRLASLTRLEAQAALACLAALVGWLTLRRPTWRVIGLAPAVMMVVAGVMLGGPVSYLLAGAIVGGLAGWFAPSTAVDRWPGWLGAITLLWLVAVVLQVKVPMAAWIVAWPVLVAAATAMLVAWADPRFAAPWSWWIAGVGLVASTAPLVPLAHLMFLGIGAPMPVAMLLFLLPVAMAVWPLARVERAWRPVLLAIGILLLAAVAIAVQVRTDPIAETIPAYSLDK